MSGNYNNHIFLENVTSIYICRQSAEAENQMVSVERVIEYADLSSEAPLESFVERKPPKNWPSKAEIEFQNLCVKYGSETDPFLKSISCVIRPLEKV